MKIIKSILLFHLVIFFNYGCKTKSEVVQERINEYLENVKTDTPGSELGDSLKASFSEPISINVIKDLDFLATTSGVVPISENKKFCKPDKDGFFGFYHLLNKNSDYQMMGILTVFTTDEPKSWKFGSSNEELTQLELETSDIQIWNGIHVGMNKTELIMDFIGNKFHYQKDTLLYAEIGGYASSFIITSDTVSRINLTKTCEKPITSGKR